MDTGGRRIHDRLNCLDSTGSANESIIYFLSFHPIYLCLTPRDLSVRKVSSLSRLKAHFHNQSSTYNKDIFVEVNPKKSSWSPPEEQFRLLIFLSDNVDTILTD